MYIPPYYNNDDLKETKTFIAENSFGILINQTNNKLWATHIPLELETDKDGNDVLQGHISKANPQWKNFTNDNEVLAIFNGPHSYISSSWYDHDNVPTWNYIAVHVYGTIRIIDDENEVLLMLEKLVDKYEATQKCPVSVKTMTKRTLREVRGIVAFEIKINDIQSAKKLSQNRDDKNHANIVSELEETNRFNEIEIAKAMQKERTNSSNK